MWPEYWPDTPYPVEQGPIYEGQTGPTRIMPPRPAQPQAAPPVGQPPEIVSPPPAEPAPDAVPMSSREPAERQELRSARRPAAIPSGLDTGESSPSQSSADLTPPRRATLPERNHAVAQPERRQNRTPHTLRKTESAAEFAERAARAKAFEQSLQSTYRPTPVPQSRRTSQGDRSLRAHASVRTNPEPAPLRGPLISEDSQPVVQIAPSQPELPATREALRTASRSTRNDELENSWRLPDFSQRSAQALAPRAEATGRNRQPLASERANPGAPPRPERGSQPALANRQPDPRSFVPTPTPPVDSPPARIPRVDPVVSGWTKQRIDVWSAHRESFEPGDPSNSNPNLAANPQGDLPPAFPSAFEPLAVSSSPQNNNITPEISPLFGEALAEEKHLPISFRASQEDEPQAQPAEEEDGSIAIRLLPPEEQIARCPPCEAGIDPVSACQPLDVPQLCCGGIWNTPEMFGDVFLVSSCEEFDIGGGTLTANFPGLRLGQKVAENNHPLPRCRAYYSFNWLNDAVEHMFNSNGTIRNGTNDVFRHTVGFEYAFCCNKYSIEVRAPFDHSITERQTFGGNRFGYDFGGIGNVMINTKMLIKECPNYAWSAGLGLEVPTGQDTSTVVNNVALTLDNEAFHIHPYVAYVCTPTERCFFEAFTQVDWTTGGNGISLFDPGFPPAQSLGSLKPPTTLFADAMLGYWIYCCDPCRKITSLAAMAEVHYVTELEDPDTITRNFGGGEVVLCAAGAHGGINTLNLTFGLHAECCDPCSAFRIAAAFPVTEERLFASELIFQWNRRL